MPTVRLNDDAQKMIQNYRWNGNIRQLKNIAEQLIFYTEAKVVKHKRKK